MAQAIAVRVIEYALPGLAGGQPRYRPLTTLLDPQVAPALELAAVYHQRWEIEAVFDELKTHRRQSRRVLRSKTAELVRQEFHGWVLAHYSVRWLLHQGATRHRIPHGELSFTGHVQLLRRAQPRSGAFPPARPRRRRRWFDDLLEACARIRATRTLNKRSPRMSARSAHPGVDGPDLLGRAERALRVMGSVLHGRRSSITISSTECGQRGGFCVL